MKLLEHFHELTLRPENAKKLKGLILQLAVQGKLTAQWRLENPDVEPAEKLLERIREEKARLIRKGEIKKEKPLPPVREKEIPYATPDGWVWCKLGEVTNYGTSDKVEPEKLRASTWVLELEDIEKSTSKLLKKVKFLERRSKSTKNKFFKNDVIYGKLRPYLDKVIVADESGVCTTEMIPLNGYGHILPHYLRWYLKNPKFIEYANNMTHGMNLPRLSTENARKAYFPLPPLEEQKAIVEIVDRLFKEVDQLEELTEKRVRLKENFAASALHNLTNGDTAGNWRFLKEHFHTFFNETPNIKKLRETILQLAVQGKLTRSFRQRHPELISGQNSAPALLERIREEKQRLIKEGKIKKEKPLPPVTEEEIPYEAPEGWVWCRLGEYVHNYGQKKPDKKFTYIDVGSIENRNGIITNNVNVLTPEEAPSRARKIAKNNCVIYSTVRPYLLNIAIVKKKYEFEPIVSTAFAVFSPVAGCLSEYLFYYLRSQTFIEYVEGQMIGVAYPAINDGNLLKGLVPIPPIEEQKAIVEEVDSLMNLCDQLEAQVEEGKEFGEKLMMAVVRETAEGEKYVTRIEDESI